MSVTVSIIINVVNVLIAEASKLHSSTDARCLGNLAVLQLRSLLAVALTAATPLLKNANTNW